MSIAQVEILIIAIFVSASCSVIGNFLILRSTAMMSDAISHSVLLGIVLVFFIVQSLNSPFLIVGAALSGLATVLLIDLFNRKKYINKDASIGFVFSLLFSIAIIVISMYARNVHLDVNVALLGELAFAPFNRFMVNGLDIGPKSLYVMATLFVLNLLFVVIFYKELKITTFDRSLSKSFGFSPSWINLMLMAMVSITCVAAFDAVGSVLVIAYMIIPPATAFLITERLSLMIIVSVIIGVVASVIGFFLADLVNANIAGSISVVCGSLFMLTMFFSPKNGIIFSIRENIKKRYFFSQHLLLSHLSNHEGTPEYESESSISHLYGHMLWSEKFGKKVINMAQKNGLILMSNDHLVLTTKGKSYVKKMDLLHGIRED